MAGKSEAAVSFEGVMVGFVGAGRMAQAMCRGFINSGLIKPTDMLASDPDIRMINTVKGLGVGVADSNRSLVERCKVVVLAVKPHMVNPVLQEVKSSVTPDHLFVSIAGGITIGSIESVLPGGTRVMRVMPNTPALVQTGASVFSRGAHSQQADVDMVTAMFSAIGICAESTESHLDAVTGLSGSGPAYAFIAIEALADGGVKMGLPRDISIKLAAQTLMGAAKMVLETEKHPGELKDAVCSPAGTTIAAVHQLEKNNFRGILMSAVEAATKRSKELGS